jgi:hypothetical protein
MPTCTVLIGAPELLPALRERTGLTGEVLTFSDQEPLRALEAIAMRRPDVVALERLFAATSRGAALINRIKSDPNLLDSEIRIVSHDSDYVRISRRPRAAAATTSIAIEAPPKPERPLDWHGTRRAPRVRIRDGVECLIDGNTALVIDLSTIGAQVISQVVLRPNQRVRMTLVDEAGVVRFNAAVAWASFEIPTGTPRYRAGIEFTDADARAVSAFAERYRKN